MDESKRGEEIIKAVFKASLRALISIGVKSPEFVDKFTLNFSQFLDDEFLKIGLFTSPNQVKAQENEAVGNRAETVEAPGPKNINESIAVLKLRNLTKIWLEKQGIKTISDLMTYMQNDALTNIKGIKEKSAKEILKKLSLWNQQI